MTPAGRPRGRRPARGELRRGWRRGIDPFYSGLVAIAAVLLAFVLAYSGGLPFDLPGTGGREVEVQVASAQGLLIERSPVRVAGVDVGAVKKIERGAGGTAIVTAELNDQAPPVHTDARAKVRPRTFLEGNYFIDLLPGSPSAPQLEDGGMIPIARTSTPVQFDQVVGIFDKDTRDQLRVGLRQLGNGFSPDAVRSFNRAIPHFEPGLRDFATAVRALRGHEPHDLSGSIAAVAKTNAAFAADRPALDSAVGSFATVAAALADEQDALGATVSELAGVLRISRPALAAVDRAIAPTRALVADLRPTLREATPTIDRARPLVAIARRLLRPSQLPELARLLSRPVRDLAAFGPEGIAIFEQLDPALRCANTAVVPTLLTDVDDGHLSTGEPTYRELLWTFLGLGSASQNFDGNGFETRFHAGFGDQLISTEAKAPSETLFGSAATPVLGSRPLLPDEQPPFLRKRSCVGEPAPDLASPTGPTGLEQSGDGATTLSGSTPTEGELERAFEDLESELGAIESGKGRQP